MKKLQVILLLCLIAFFNASYLVYKWYCVNFLEPTQSFCDINATYSCSNVLAHPAAMIWGVPFPAIAMLVYPILALVAFLWYTGRITSHWKILTILSGLWILFNGYFIYQETFVIQAFCPLCILCSAIIISIFVLSITSYKKND